MTQTEFETLLNQYRERADHALEDRLYQAKTHPSRLHDAIRYATLNGGKRVRPFLVYATGVALGATLDQLDPAAAALEMIHSYSLVHDDLPAMDDDDLRRNQPTCHIQYDEATAILVGDALQAQAFYILSHDKAITASAELRLKMIEQLSLASGSRGMVGGQAIDLESVGKQIDLAQLEDMHIHKTGALIRASVLLGAFSAGFEMDSEQVKALDHYAKCIGLAFQIQDDILDIEGNTEDLGKQAGADAALNKPTYPGLLGMSEAKQRAKELVENAKDSLSVINNNAEPLKNLADYIIARSH